MKMETLAGIMMIIGLLLIIGSIVAFVWKVSPGFAVLTAGIMLAGIGCTIYEAVED